MSLVIAFSLSSILSCCLVAGHVYGGFFGACMWALYVDANLISLHVWNVPYCVEVCSLISNRESQKVSTMEDLENDIPPRAGHCSQGKTENVLLDKIDLFFAFAFMQEKLTTDPFYFLLPPFCPHPSTSRKKEGSDAQRAEPNPEKTKAVLSPF